MAEGPRRRPVHRGNDPAQIGIGYGIGGDRQALAKAHAKSGDPERRRKISEAKKGKPRPWAVIEKLIKAGTGRKATAETRAKMSATHKGRGTRPPACRGLTWSPEDDEVLRSLSPKKAAVKLRRTLGAVYSRRWELELPDARRNGASRRT
jgi:hypothetical protein